MNLQVVKLLNHDMGRVNKVYIASNNDAELSFIVVKNNLFKFENHSLINQGKIALSNVQREYLSINIDSTIRCEFMPIKNVPVISLIRFSCEIINLGTHELSKKEIIEGLRSVNMNCPFNKGQIFYYFHDEMAFRITVTELIASTEAENGILIDRTNVYLTSAQPRLVLVGQEESLLLKSDFSFEDLQIGGLKKEFGIMFRRAFVQRVFDSDTIQKLGIPHVKGILLYGPPGTGKTLIARQIGSLLNTRAPKIVNGPEILNKYVGQSEENIRLLFKDAEDEYKKKGPKSQLHMIIFDELDAIFKSRGSSSNNIGDQVVNQLLSKMDGVEALDNVLIIGMTNRPDLIDRALLRPGRFEIHIEIALPDEPSRLEIFKIHTKEMTKNNYINSNVNLTEMSKLTRNYTGAEICAVIKSAASFALERNVHGKTMGTGTSELQAENNIDITMNDFMTSLDEVKPSFGFNEAEFHNFSKTYYDLTTFLNGFELGKEFIDKLYRTNAYKTSSLLLYGTPGTGKTTLAVKIALSSSFPFIKMISPKHMVGLSEYERVNYIKDRFCDAYKSSESIIILDEIESLVDYVAIGPRFSNTVLQAIKIFIKTEEKNKLFVIATTSDIEFLRDSGLYDIFYGSYCVDEVNDFDMDGLIKQNNEFGKIDCVLPSPIKNLIARLGNDGFSDL